MIVDNFYFGFGFDVLVGWIIVVDIKGIWLEVDWIILDWLLFGFLVGDLIIDIMLVD